MAARLIKLLFLFLLVNRSLCCNNGGDDGGDDEEYEEEPDEEEEEDPDDEEEEEDDPPTEKANEDPVEKCLGEGASDSLEEFVDGDETEATEGSELDCDFSGRTCDCWSNNVENDELDWVTGDDADPDAIEECFPDTDANIEGEYLLIFSQDGEARKDKAILQSCTIECAKSAKVSMDVLMKGGDLKVCGKKKDDSQANAICQDVFDSGRVTVELPPKADGNYENVDIYLVADSLVAGSLIVVDNLEVVTEPCTEDTTEPPEETEPTEPTEATEATEATEPTEPEETTPGETGDPCPLACDFESDCSSYEPVPEGQDGTTGTWEKSVEKIGNRDTGIRQSTKRTEGNFAGSQIMQQGTSAMKVSGLSGTEGKKIKIKYYDATKDMQFKVCKDAGGKQCLFESEKGVKLSDREWKETEVTLEETEELYFVCDNQSDDIGCCGVDQVTVLDSDGSEIC